MNISNIDRLLLKSYNDFSLNKIKVNNLNKIQSKDISLKELNTYIDTKHLAIENLDSKYNLNVNEKYQKHLDENLSKLNKMRDKILVKDEKDNKTKNEKTDKKVDNSTKEDKNDEKILNEEEKAMLYDIEKQISNTNNELKEVIKAGEKLIVNAQIVSEKVDSFKKFYGSDIFKKSEKDALLKYTFDVYNNPFVKKLKSTFNDIIKLENEINEKLNKQEEKNKVKKINYKKKL